MMRQARGIEVLDIVFAKNGGAGVLRGRHLSFSAIMEFCGSNGFPMSAQNCLIPPILLFRLIEKPDPASSPQIEK